MFCDIESMQGRERPSPFFKRVDQWEKVLISISSKISFSNGPKVVFLRHKIELARNFDTTFRFKYGIRSTLKDIFFKCFCCPRRVADSCW